MAAAADETGGGGDGGYSACDVVFTESVRLRVGHDGRLRLNSFAVLGCLGRGAFAEVLLAVRPALAARV